MRILSHALPVYIFDPVCPLFLLLYNPAAPRHYLLTALLYMPKGLFCQIPHRGQRPPSLPYRSPGFQSSLGYNLIPPSPIPKSIHLIHPYLSIYLSVPPCIPLSWPAGRPACLPTVWLHISSLLCFVGFLATHNSHDRAPGQREPLASQQLAIAHSSVQNRSYS